MTTYKKLTIATANLFNFIEPPGAFYDFENIYDGKAWQEKCEWTKNQIQQLNADIIGIQEIFSVDAARILFEEIGYPYFASVDIPQIEQDYIYSKPVVAVASKYPITHFEAVTPLTDIQSGYQIPVPEFSRKPVYAIINSPDIGEIAVYVCHLKSQRATESNTPLYSHPLIGRWISSQQRGWEAVMLRLFMEQKYLNHPVPTLLIGDMNQPLVSDITGLLTTELPTYGSSDDYRQLILQDSWNIFSNSQTKVERQPTHYHFSNGNVLDYILLSQEFQAHSQYSVADVTAYTVLDKHLINPSYERDKQASDHAFVAITAHFVL